MAFICGWNMIFRETRERQARIKERQKIESLNAISPNKRIPLAFKEIDEDNN